MVDILLKRGWIALAGLGIFVATSSCTFTNPEKAPMLAGPKSPATKNITSFTPALSCMDDLFARYGIRSWVITSSGLPDQTGQIQAGTKEMMISAISRMSAKSHAFSFVDLDSTQIGGVEEVYRLIGERYDLGFQIPRYYIRGAVTQLDQGVTTDRVNAGMSIPEAALGLSADQLVSVVSMDVNVADMVTRQIMAGLNATNSISVVKTGRGADVDGVIDKLGLMFNLAMDRSEGPHQAVRTLIELSMIEVLGKLTKVPYWRCLDIPQTSPEAMREARKWYDTMSSEELVALIQDALVRGGYLGGSASGKLDGMTRDAIGRYEAEHNLIATGRITFELYYSLQSHDLIPPRHPEAFKHARVGGLLGGKAIPVERETKSVLGTAVKIDITTNRGDRPAYRVGDELWLKMRVYGDGAYVYCYYSDEMNQIARIFPNRFQPNGFLLPNQDYFVPNEESEFDIVMEEEGVSNSILCLASRREIGASLPPAYRVDDLTPLAVHDLSEVRQVFQDLDHSGLVAKQIDIKVVPRSSLELLGSQQEPLEEERTE